jgi:HlyD family type I secretion membrane fusion protein
MAPTSDSARGLIFTGFALIAAFFLGFGGWASLVTLENAVMGDGVVTVENVRQPVQHRDGGLVRELLVKEGMRVEKGQPLLRLDTTEAQASLDVLMAQMDGLLAREARLLAERSDAEAISWPVALSGRQAESAAVRAVLDEEQQVFAARRTALLGELGLNRQKLAQLRKDWLGADTQRLARQQQLDLIRQELDGQMELFEKGYARKTRMYELQRAVAGLEGSVAEAGTEMAKTEEHIRTVEKEYQQIQAKRTEEVVSDLKDTRQKLSELAPRIEALREQLGRSMLLAPETGHVLGMSITAAGNVIAPGSKVMDIVPEAEALTLDVQVRPEDIEDVRVGQRAEVRFMTFRDLILPEIYGTVTRVSADRLSDPRTGAAYYSVRITINDTAEFRRLGLRLQPGMPVSALIPGAARSVLNYLIWPLKKQLDGAFREK